jgi:hypothetical protein
MYDQTMSSIDICLILFIITDESTTPLSTEIWLSTYPENDASRIEVFSYDSGLRCTANRVYTVKILLFVGTNIHGFYKMKWSMGSWIYGF